MPDESQDRTHGGVHPIASAGYASGADSYEAGRPDYPAAVLDWLRDIVGLGAGRLVLEVGAGAGAFTSRLVTTGARVCAVEPVAAMRVKLARRAAGTWVVAGTAESLPVRDAALDVVVCAQSFHWFATRQALEAFHRALEPDGMLALVWNVRDETVPWVKRLLALTDGYEGAAPRYAKGEWQQAFAGPGFVEVDRREARHSHTGPVDQVVVARTLSVSFVAALPRETRAAIEGRLHRFIDQEPELAGRTAIAVPYRTVMYAYRRVR